MAERAWSSLAVEHLESGQTALSSQTGDTRVQAQLEPAQGQLRELGLDAGVLCAIAISDQRQR